jgi:multidrug efflux pump subunit AcrA (membrane-fusion protein)
MDLLIILTYAAFAYGAFRLFKIPVNGFTLLTAALGGVAIISALLLGMNYNHPYTSQARFYFNTTPIIPAVSGVVTEVPVKANTMLKAGDILFRIDPEPFENAVTPTARRARFAGPAGRGLLRSRHRQGGVDGKVRRNLMLASLVRLNSNSREHHPVITSQRSRGER